MGFWYILSIRCCFCFGCTNVSLVASLLFLAGFYGQGVAFPPGVWKVGAAVRGWRCRQDKARPRGSSFELIFVKFAMAVISR